MLTNSQQFKKNFLTSLPHFGLGMFLFISISALLGSSNALLGIIFLFFSLGMITPSFSLKSFIKDGFIFLLLAILATFATMSYPGAILLDFVVIFSLIFAYSDDFSQRNYFIFGLEFILLQSRPGSLDMLLDRILAVIYAVMITGIFIVVMRRLRKVEYNHLFVHNGFSAISTQLDQLVNGEFSKIQLNELYRVTADYSVSQYSSIFKQNGVLAKHENDHFQLLLHLEQMGQLISVATSQKDNLSPSDLTYFSRLSQIVRENSNHQELANQISTFLNEYNLNDSFMNEDWTLTLRSIERSLKLIDQKETRPLSFKDKFLYKSNQLKQHWGLNYFQFRFAIQSAIVVATSAAVANLLPFTYSYWITVTAYTTLSTYSDETVQKAFSRLFGTLTGMLFFFLITQFIPADYRVYAALLIGFSIMLSVNSIFVKTLFGTQISFSIIYPIYNWLPSILLRGGSVVVGSIFAIVGNRYIFPTNRQDSYNFKLNELLQYDKSLLSELNHALETKSSSRHTNELFLSLHLVTHELSKNLSQKNIYEKWLLSQLIIANNKFLTEAHYILMTVKLSETTVEHHDVFKQEIQLLGDLIKSRTTEHNRPDTSTLSFQNMKEKSHLDHHIISCSAAFKKVLILLYHSNNGHKKIH